MGQYYVVVNLDKKQFLHPHAFGDGVKLLEFGSSGDGTMCGLAVLLANSNGRGGGDLRSNKPVVGSWAGDRIVIAGDYSDPWVDPQDLNAPVVESKGPNLYDLCNKEEGYEDISEKVVEALCDDRFLKEEFQKRARAYSFVKLPASAR